MHGNTLPMQEFVNWTTISKELNNFFCQLWPSTKVLQTHKHQKQVNLQNHNNFFGLRNSVIIRQKFERWTHFDWCPWEPIADQTKEICTTIRVFVVTMENSVSFPKNRIRFVTTVVSSRASPLLFSI